MEMSFLSNFNTLVQILSGSIDLLESNESMKFLFYKWGLQKRILDLLLRNQKTVHVKMKY